MSIRFSVEINEVTGKLESHISESPVGQVSGSKYNDFYVYEWFIVSSGEVFYIGKGRGNRYKNYHTHAYEAERIRSMYETDVKFVGVGLTEEEAVELETHEMLRILNETSDRLTNRITPILAKRDNGYSRSPNTPPLQFETTPCFYATEIDEHYYGVKPRNFDRVDERNLDRVHFIEKKLFPDEEKTLYGGNYQPYYNAVNKWLISKGCRPVKSKFAKSVSAWIYISDDDIHNYNIDQKLAVERIGRTVPVYHLIDLWHMANKTK